MCDITLFTFQHISAFYLKIYPDLCNCPPSSAWLSGKNHRTQDKKHEYILKKVGRDMSSWVCSLL